MPEVVSNVGDPQVRHRGTIGGSAAHGDPASDVPAMLLATRRDAGGPGPERHTGDRGRRLLHRVPRDRARSHEVLTEIRLPKAAGAGFGFQKFTRRAQDWAIVGVAVQRSNGGAGVGLVNMGSAPLRAAAVESALDDGASAADAAAKADEGAEPPSRPERLGRVPPPSGPGARPPGPERPAAAPLAVQVTGGVASYAGNSRILARVEVGPSPAVLRMSRSRPRSTIDRRCLGGRAGPGRRVRTCTVLLVRRQPGRAAGVVTRSSTPASSRSRERVVRSGREVLDGRAVKPSEATACRSSPPAARWPDHGSTAVASTRGQVSASGSTAHEPHLRVRSDAVRLGCRRRPSLHRLDHHDTAASPSCTSAVERGTHVAAGCGWLGADRRRLPRHRPGTPSTGHLRGSSLAAGADGTLASKSSTGPPVPAETLADRAPASSPASSRCVRPPAAASRHRRHRGRFGPVAAQPRLAGRGRRRCRTARDRRRATVRPGRPRGRGRRSSPTPCDRRSRRQRDTTNR